MDFFFGKPKPSVKDVMKGQKREFKKTERTLDRDIRGQEREEAKLEAQIKSYAKKGDTATAKLLAKQLVKMRQTKQRTMVGKSQISGLAMNAQSMAATHTMVGAMGTATKAMGTMNKAMDPGKMNQVMQGFQQEQAKMEMTQEMMADAMDSIWDDDEDEVDETVNAVLDEIAMDVTAGMSSTVGMAQPQHDAVAEPEVSEAQAKLQARLASLGSG